MMRVKAVFRCQSCGAEARKWAGRCAGCDEWNTLVEETEVAGRPGPADLGPAEHPLPIDEVDVDTWATRPTGIPELDRVLGGGLVPGSVTLLGGEPGIGKSTLLLN